MLFITARKRSAWLPGGRAWLVGGMRGFRGVCVVAWGACVVARGVCIVKGACVAKGGGHAWDMTRYGDTINERAVRILLECILVNFSDILVKI